MKFTKEEKKELRKAFKHTYPKYLPHINGALVLLETLFDSLDAIEKARIKSPSGFELVVSIQSKSDSKKAKNTVEVANFMMQAVEATLAEMGLLKS